MRENDISEIVGIILQTNSTGITREMLVDECQKRSKKIKGYIQGVLHCYVVSKGFGTEEFVPVGDIDVTVEKILRQIER